MYKPQKSEIEQQLFFRKSYDKFLQAKDAAGEINFYYRIANTTICLKFAGNELVPSLTPALEHLRLTGDTAARSYDLYLGQRLNACGDDSSALHKRLFHRPGRHLGFQQPSYKSGFSLDRMFCQSHGS